MDSITTLHHRWIDARFVCFGTIRNETPAGARQRHYATARRLRSIDRIATTRPADLNDLSRQIHAWWTEYGPHDAKQPEGDDHLEPTERFIVQLSRAATGRMSIRTRMV